MKKNVDCLPIIFISTPLIIGVTVGMLTIPKSNINSILPSWIFPLVWTILYILMGISSYIIYKETNTILKIYLIQLLFNYTWIFIFFTFKSFIFAFIWIIILIILVFLMIKKFLSINKTSAYLQIPYLIWLLLASILNLMFII
mgnify:FL=1